MMLPLNKTSDDGPTYVNAKQYHGIIRRRHHICMNRAISNNGNGNSGSEANKKGLGHQLHSSGSQNSEVLRSSAGTSNSLKETNGSSPNISSEVTSMYSSRRGIDGFAINHIGTPMHSLTDMMDTGHGHSMIMPAKWVSAVVGNCCNLNV
ncbi:hypothetical protein S83_040323 [Arachis hypogaea]